MPDICSFCNLRNESSAAGVTLWWSGVDRCFSKTLSYSAAAALVLGNGQSNFTMQANTKHLINGDSIPMGAGEVHSLPSSPNLRPQKISVPGLLSTTCTPGADVDGAGSTAWIADIALHCHKMLP